MRQLGMQPTFWMVCCITRLIYRFRSITQIQAVKPLHVFAMCHLLGFRFAPRMRDLPDKKLYTFEPTPPDSVLAPLLGDKINVKLIEESWDEILRLASSIRTGTVTASLMLRKLASYPRQNRLALALRE